MPACLLCSTPAPLQAVMPLDAKTFRPTPHGRIYYCAGCLLGFIHPRPDDTSGFYDLDAYYTQGASHMPDVVDTGLAKVRNHLAWRADHGETLLAVMLEALAPGSTVVDIGCGGGALLRQLTAAGHQAVGVERDAASLSRQDLHVLEGTAEKLPNLDPCDAVVFSHVLEHLDDPVAAICSASKLLKPGGLLFCEVPNNESLIARRSRMAWEHLDVPRHINFFTEPSLVKTVESSGMKPIRSYFSGYCRYFSGSFIATEQRIYDRLAELGKPDAVRNSGLRSWDLLGRTAWARPRVKYDSVGVVARVVNARKDSNP